MATITTKQLIIHASHHQFDSNLSSPKDSFINFETTGVPGIVPEIEQTCIRYDLDRIPVYFFTFFWETISSV